jgi:hypothetical protein
MKASPRPAHLLDALRAPFPAADIEWRIGQAGFTAAGKPWATCLAYLTARAIQDRLDEVVGPANWQVEYRPLSLEAAGGTAPGIICRLGILSAQGWVWKEDGADQPDTEPFKGGLSNAMKRCAVQWGIGRYLYALPMGFARFVTSGGQKVEVKDKSGSKREWMRWEPPALPAEFLPAGTPRPSAAELATGSATLEEHEP